MKKIYFTLIALVALVLTNTLQFNGAKAQFNVPPSIVETFQGSAANRTGYGAGGTTNDAAGRPWKYYGALVANSANDPRPMSPRIRGISTSAPTTGGYIETGFTVKGLKRIAVQFMPFSAHANADHVADPGPDGFVLTIYTSINNGADWVNQGSKTAYKDGNNLASPVVLDVSPNIIGSNDVLLKLVNESPSTGATDASAGNRISILQVALWEDDTKPAFTPGNLVLYRHNIGASVNGSSATSMSTASFTTNGNMAIPVYLDEYKLAADGNSLELVQTVSIPALPDGASAALTTLGNTTYEGRMTRSYDGRYLVLPGYGVAPGIYNEFVNNSRPDEVPRVAGLVDFKGKVNTTTVLNNDPNYDLFSEAGYRSATAYDGAGAWLTGGTSSSWQVEYTIAGSTSPTTRLALGSGKSPREVKFANGELYFLTETQLYKIGSGVPTTATTATAIDLGTVSKLTSFYIADLGAGQQVLYVADVTLGGIRKYSLVSGSWVANGTLSIANPQALEGTVSGGIVKLFVLCNTDNAAYGDSKIYSVEDNTGHNVAISATPKLLLDKSTGNAKINFRGIALAPVAESTLPVKLNSFGVNYRNNEVLLTWKTSSESNNSHFEVLRSDGTVFSVIGTVKGSSNSNSGQTYHFIDRNPLSGVAYYQLRQIDLDGKTELSGVVSVKMALAANGLSVYAAANKQYVQLSFNVEKAAQANVIISNLSGQKIATAVQQVEKGTNSFAVPAPLKKGVYIVALTINGVQQVSKLVVE